MRWKTPMADVASISGFSPRRARGASATDETLAGRGIALFRAWPDQMSAEHNGCVGHDGLTRADEWSFRPPQVTARQR